MVEKKNNLNVKKKLRGLLEIFYRGSGIENRRSGIEDRFFEKLERKINESWIVVRMWAEDG